MHNVFVNSSELNETLDQPSQGFVSSPKPFDTSTDTIDSRVLQKVLSKKTFKKNKSYAAAELGRSFYTGATDSPGKPSQFYCGICHTDVSAPTNGPKGILPRFHGARHFPRAQRLRLETPGWWVLIVEGKPLSDDLGGQRDKILMAPLVKWNRERVFTEDFLVNQSGAADTNLPVARLLSLMEVFRLGGSYELIERLWGHLMLNAGRVDVEVAWSREERLVRSKKSQ